MGKKVIESLDTLLQWIEDDPVDTWEMTRNDLTEIVQGNRNVFIDFPELAFSLFGKDIPDNLQTPTNSGCHHEYSLSEQTDSDCIHTGCIEYVCGNCGQTRTKTMHTISHKDNDSDHYCDVCETLLSHVPGFTPAETIKAGDHLILYNPENGIIPAGYDGSGKLDTKAITAEDIIYPDTDAAIFFVEEAEGGFYLVSEGM